MEEAEAVSWDPEPGIVFTDREVAPGVDPPHPTQVFIHSHPKHCCSYCCPPGTKKKKDLMKVRAVLDVWTKDEGKIKRGVDSTWQDPGRVLRGGDQRAGL